jgi:thymidylate kinase
MAKIICFEGPDGVGKTTQAKILEEILINKDYKVKYYKLPSQTFIGRYIYQLLKNGFARKYQNIFQFINFIDKFVFQIYHLLLNKYDYIILDRWKMSSVVYGRADGGNKKFLEFLSKFLINPDITFVFFGSDFLQNKIQKDDYEKDVSILEKAKTFYLVYGYITDNCQFITSNEEIERVTENIQRYFTNKFNNKETI